MCIVITSFAIILDVKRSIYIQLNELKPFCKNYELVKKKERIKNLKTNK